MSSAAARLNLYEFTRPELGELLASWGLNAVHATRLWNYLYYTGVRSFDEMTELPARVLEHLRERSELAHLRVASETHSSDGFTRKYLLELRDGRKIETVLMRFTGLHRACHCLREQPSRVRHGLRVLCDGPDGFFAPSDAR
jgi:23S rRNA (adenine2503-C2)-methyltransferase